MDADFSHDPKYLPAFLAAIEKHDLVLGSRYVPGGGVKNWGLLRKIISRGGSLYARTILGLSLRDLTGGDAQRPDLAGHPQHVAVICGGDESGRYFSPLCDLGAGNDDYRPGTAGACTGAGDRCHGRFNGTAFRHL